MRNYNVHVLSNYLSENEDMLFFKQEPAKYLTLWKNWSYISPNIKKYGKDGWGSYITNSPSTRMIFTSIIKKKLNTQWMYMSKTERRDFFVNSENNQ